MLSPVLTRLSPVAARRLVSLACPLLAVSCAPAELDTPSSGRPPVDPTQLAGPMAPAVHTAGAAAATTTTEAAPIVGAAAGAAPPGLRPEPAPAAPTCPPGAAVNAAVPAGLEPIVRRGAEVYLQRCREARLTIDVTGSSDALGWLCAGIVDLAGTTRAARPEESEPCQRAGRALTPVRIGSQSVVIATSRHNDHIGCLSFPDLYALLGRESAGFDRWIDAAELASSLGSSVRYPGARLELAGPARASPLSELVTELVLAPTSGSKPSPAPGEAGGDQAAPLLRADFDGGGDPDEIVEALARTETSLGWVSLATAAANQERIRAIALSQQPGDRCVEPTAETVEDGTYPASRPLHLHVAPGPDGISAAARSFVSLLLGAGHRKMVATSAELTGYVPLPAGPWASMVEPWATGSG